MSEERTPELLPCPFCGGKAKIYMEHKKIGLTLWGECTECSAKTDGYRPKDDLESFEECKELAIAAWNRRAYEQK